MYVEEGGSTSCSRDERQDGYLGDGGGLGLAEDRLVVWWWRAELTSALRQACGAVVTGLEMENWEPSHDKSIED